VFSKFRIEIGPRRFAIRSICETLKTRVKLDAADPIHCRQWDNEKTHGEMFSISSLVKISITRSFPTNKFVFSMAMLALITVIQFLSLFKEKTTRFRRENENIVFSIGWWNSYIFIHIWRCCFKLTYLDEPEPGFSPAKTFFTPSLLSSY
jgi:hypothetical protein